MVAPRPAARLLRASVAAATGAALVVTFGSSHAATALSPQAAPSAPYQYLGYFPTGNYVDSVAVDPSTHRVYASGNENLTTYDGSAGSVLHTTTVGGEEGVAVDPANHAVYVSTFLGRAFGVVDGTSGDFLQYVPVGYGPNQIALDRSSHTLYVADQANGAGHVPGVSVVGEGSDTESTIIPIPEGAVALALDAANHRLYVSHFSDYKIAVIDTGSNQVIDTIDLGVDPISHNPNGFVNGMALDPATGKLWVSSGTNGNVLVIDESTNTIEKVIHVGYSMWGIGINPAQGLVFVADQANAQNQVNTGSVAILDEANESLITTIQIGGEAHGLAVDPDLDRVYVTDAYPGNARVVILGTVPTYGPGTLAFTSRNYTTNAGTGSQVTVRRTGATNLESTVDYATSPGTGVAGTDYTSKSGTLTFPAGATSETFTVTTAKHGPITASPTVNLTLSNATGGSLRDPFTATLHLRESTPPLVQHQAPPDTLTLGHSYSYTYTATGSPAPTWSVASGTLPGGLTLNSTTGVLSGTPTAAGPATFSVQADNGAAPTSTSQQVTVTVKGPPSFTAQSPPTTANKGDYFAYQYKASGTPAPTFSLASGSLPAGTEVVASNGYVAGTLRGRGVFTFRIKASNGVSPDAISSEATVTVSGAAIAPDAPTVTGVSAGNHAATASFAPPTYNGGDPIVHYTVSSSPGGFTKQGTASPLTVTGLTNGTAYTFTVVATNGVGTSTPSGASGPVTPSAASAATALKAAASGTIRAGATVTVSAKLTDKGSAAPISGASVELLSRTSTTNAFTHLATLTTSPTGVAGAKEKPVRTTQYEFAYHGTATHAASASGVQSVSVAYVVAASVKPGSLNHSKPAKVYGTVSPGKTGDPVTLQQLVHGTWKTLKATATLKTQKLPNGKTALGYVFTIAAAPKGTYEFRVSRSASTTNVAGVSGTLKLVRT